MAVEPRLARLERRIRWRERLFGCAGPWLPAGSEAWRGGAPILLYHRVSEAGHPPRSPFSVSADAFDRQMAWLAGRFQCVTVGELVRRLAQGEGAGLAAVSFDDGYTCTVERALPVLRARGVPATVFLDTGRLDGPPPALDERGVRTLADSGVEIGSHGVRHVDLTALTDAALRAELAGSRERLAALTGQAVDGLASPFGRHDARVARAAREVGYRYACTCRQDRANRPGDDPFHLARIEINASDTPRRFAAKLAGRYAPLYAAWYRLGGRMA